MPSIRNLLEMALDLGGEPDSIHPAHKRALSSGQHGLGGVPAMTPQSAERHASETYRHIVQKLREFGGIIPRNTGQGEVMRAMMDMMRTLQDVQQREAQHRPQLEQLAVETVLRLPEFKSLRQAVQNGTVRIEAHLEERINIENFAFSDQPHEEMPGEDVPEIQAEYQEMINRRKLANTITQGAAVANNYAFTNSFDELVDIDRTLVRDYGKVMAYSELGFFVQSPEMMRMAAQAAGSEVQGGQVMLKPGENGEAVIYAEAITYPMLVQEIIKGCMELLAQSEEEDFETARAVRKRSDFIDDEQIQMQVGPSIYRSFINAIGQANADLMPYIYDHLNKLSGTEYNQVMQGLINGTPDGIAWFRNLARELRQKLDVQEQGQQLGDEILGGEDEPPEEPAY